MLNTPNTPNTLNAPRRYNRGTPVVQTAPVVRDWLTIATNSTLLLSTADVHLITLGANVTLTLDINANPDRTKVRVYLTQDGTGSRTVTWSGVTWFSGSAPTLTTTASAIDLLEFTYVSSAATWYGRPLFTKTANFSGNVVIAGTLEVDGDFSVNTTKFTVVASSGNTNVAGTLNSAGNFSVATNKFTVTASSGNTAIAGTCTVGTFLAVGGASVGSGTNYINFPGAGGGFAWNNTTRFAFDGTDFTVNTAAGGLFKIKNGGGSTMLAIANDTSTVNVGTMASTNSSAGNLCVSSSAAPTGNPTGGGFIWYEAGVGFRARGAGGTVTTFAPA